MSIATVVLVALAGPPAQAEDPERLGDEVTEVLSRPEFRYEPSWLDRLGDWIAEQLGRLLGGGPAGGPAFGGGAGAVFAWALVIVAVAAAVTAVVVALRRRGPRRAPRGDPGVEVEHRRTAAEWDADAERFEREGRWKDALRARYRSCVRTLIDRGALPDVPGLTPSELLDALAGAVPAATGPATALTRSFEQAWYAGAPVGPSEVAEAGDRAAAVLAAADRGDVPIGVPA